MELSKKRYAKKRRNKSSLISMVTLWAFLLTLIFSCYSTYAQKDSGESNNSTFAQQDKNKSNQKTIQSGSSQNYRIIVKLKNETATKAETQLSTSTMSINRGSSKNMGDLFTKYKIKKMEPAYKGLVNWKKKNGKTEKDYYNKVQKNYQKRLKRSKKQAPISINLSNTYVIEADVSSQEEYDKLLASLKKDTRFEYAEASMAVSASMLPDDPYFSSRGSWGEEFDDLYGVKVASCPEAWDTATGAGITVAVVDTGVDNTHPDIVNNMWTNTKEIPNNGVDDDNNGYIDDTWGWDFINNDNSPVDDEGHGTHVAGTIAATGNNGIGVVGVAPGAKVMAVKCLSKDGKGDDSTIANAILYAAENGADVINLSLGGKGYSQAFEEAITTAINLGAVVIVAAGNNSDDVIKYSPANIKDAITVAATDSSDQKAYFSNWGSGIDVAAPGVGILSLLASGTTKGEPKLGDKYAVLKGTSMAAPHVAGVAALILSHHPEFSTDQVGSVLRTSATDVMTTGFDYYSGYGRINASKALEINSTLEARIQSPTQGSIVIGGVTVMGTAKGNNFSGYTLEYGKVNDFGEEPAEWKLLQQSTNTVDKGQLGVFDSTGLTNGKYMIRLCVKDSSNLTYVDQVEVEVDKTKITSPASMDPSYAAEIKPGKVLAIKGSTQGPNFQRYRMEWGEGLNPTEWFTTGFTLENGGNQPVIEGLLANWDSTVYPGRAGYYQLRLIADYSGCTDEVRTFIYLEPDLASDNWPQKLENNPNSSMLPVKNAAGETSLVGLTSTTINETALVKYSYDGALQCSLSYNGFTINQPAVGNIDGNPGDETVYAADGKMRILRNDNSCTEFYLDSKYHFNDYIALQDLDNDATPEILALGTDFDSKTRYLFAFKPDGSLLSTKFPIAIPNKDMSANLSNENLSKVHYLVMDINNDGEKEIVTQQREENSDACLKLYKWDGAQIDWQAGQPSFQNVYISNMIGGDLDHDGQGEIVLSTKDKNSFDTRNIYIIASDGSIKSGWPRTLPKKNINLYSCHVAIADLDRDGTDEIIYTQLDEINVLKMDGTQLSDTWGIDSKYQYGSIVIGDINSDNYPEILAFRDTRSNYSIPGYLPRSYNKQELVAFDKNAQIIKQWGISGAGGAEISSSSSEPVLGDFDNDGKVDIAVCTSLLSESNSLVDGTLYILNTDGDYDAANMDWPVSNRDPQNSSVQIPNKPLQKATNILLNTTSASLTVGQTVQLNATVLPKGANTKVEWSIASESSSNVATVINGTVYGKHPGTAVIRAASAVDSSIYAECTVTVTEAIGGLLLSEGFENCSESSDLPVGWSSQKVNSDIAKWNTVSSGTAVDTPRSGTKMAKFNSKEEIWGGSARLYRPAGIDLENRTYRLNFWMYHEDGIVNQDCIQVQISKDNGVNWENVGNPIYRYNSSPGWKNYAISLDKYKNTSDLKIAFLAVGRGGGNMYLDDISVTEVDTLLSEGFEGTDGGGNIPIGWATSNTNAVWSVTSSGTNPNPGAPKSGSMMAKFNSYDATSGTSARLYQTSGLALGNTGDYKLEFWMYHDTGYQQCSDSIQIQVSSDGGNSWNNVGSIIKRSDGSTGWKLHTVDLNQFRSTADLRVAFFALSGYGSNIYLDDISVTCSSTEVPVTGISLNKASTTLEVNQTEQLTATVMPANATSKEVIWSVQSQSTSNVAIVSTTGLVTANNTGTAIIRATSVADSSKYVECTVTVKPAVIPVTGISLNKTSTTLEVNQTEQLTTTVMPANATNKEVIWSVQSQSTSNVVTVSSIGLITANNVGSAVIRVASVADSSKYAECTVTVKPAVISVTGISLNKASTTLEVGKTEQLISTVMPTNATNKEVSWTVQSQSASNVATVSSTGLITANNVGTAVIRVTSVADTSKYAECTVTVKPAVILVTGISLNKASTTLEVGKTEQLTSTVMPANATNKEVSWTVQSQSASNVVTVSSTGLITANNVGSAVIRVTSVADSSKYAECTVTVKPVEVPVTGTLLSEGFEGTSGGVPVGWATYSASPKAIWGVASSGTNPDPRAPKSGLTMATFNSYTAPSGTSARLYRTSGLTLGSDGKYILEFWMYHDTGYPQFVDSIQVQVSTDGGNSWNNLGSVIRRNDGNSGWKSHTVDLNQFRNTADLRIAFLALSGYGNNIYLDDISVTCTATVAIPITGISLNKASATLEVGKTEQLTSTVMPTNATNKEVSWTVQSQSASNVVTVSTTGLVAGNSVGTAVIRATSVDDPSKYAECTVTVIPAEALGIVTLLSEGFEGTQEDIPTGWAINNTDSRAMWSVASSGTDSNIVIPKSGSMMASFNSFDAPSNTRALLYRTSGLALGITGNYKLEFWMYHDTGFPDREDSIQIQVSIDGGNNWINVGSDIKRYDGSTGWKLHTVDLNEFRSTGDLRIAFLAISRGGNYMYLDDISVTRTSSEVVPVTGISLNKTSTTLEVGQTEQLTSTVMPTNATNKEVSWSVQSQSTSNVVTVSSTGLITANNVGTAVIRVTSVADSSKYAECTVTVNPAVIPVTGISLNKASTTLEVGKTEQLTSTVMPTNATNKGVIWTVQSQSTSNVATVSTTGLVAGNSVGTAVIRATSVDDLSKYAECTVTVKPTELPVTGTLLSEGFEGASGSIPTGWAINNTDSRAMWSVASSGTDSNIVTPKSGSMMAKFNSFDAPSNTRAQLYRTAGLALGITENYKLEFWMYHDTGFPDRADSIQIQVSIDGGNSWINVGSDIKRNDGSTGWKLHTVDMNEFRNTGDLRIAFYAISRGGNYMYLDDISVTCTSTAVIPVTGISLNKASATLAVGQTEQLTSTVMPANATNKEVIWTVQSQSTSNVATVSTTGLVAGNNVGTAVIRATSVADSSKYVECTVTVIPAEVLGTVTMLSESFEGATESIPAGWATNSSSSNAVWSVASSGTKPNPGAPKSGSMMAKFNSYYAPGNTSARLYQTSGLTLGSTGNYTLNFWMYHDTEQPHADSIQVQVSIDGGNSWINVGSVVKRNDGRTGWKIHTVDLNQFRNTSDLRIAFLAFSDNGNNMYLDDISVTCTSTTTTQLTGVNETPSSMEKRNVETLVASVLPSQVTKKRL